MSWLSRGPSRLEGVNQRRFYRQSIELPIAVSVGGLPAPVYGTLVDISEDGCRFRSLILIDRNREIEFQLNRVGRNPVDLRGHIISRSVPSNGGGHEYGVKFDAMTAAERAALAREIADMQRREAAARSADRDTVTVQPFAQAQRRRNVRGLASFRVQYRLPNRRTIDAEATDISTGGLRLLGTDPIPVGTLIELRFTLPNGVLEVYPPASERAEISPFGMRTVRVPDNRRPFSEMVVRGRVVSAFVPMRKHAVNGIQFLDLDGYAREEIARFSHALQLSKLRWDQ